MPKKEVIYINKNLAGLTEDEVNQMKQELLEEQRKLEQSYKPKKDKQYGN